MRDGCKRASLFLLIKLQYQVLIAALDLAHIQANIHEEKLFP